MPCAKQISFIMSNRLFIHLFPFCVGKERNRLSLLTSPKESRAGVKEHSPLPGPETLAMVEGMAHRLLNEDEVAAVMRHCRRVSGERLIRSICIHALRGCFDAMMLWSKATYCTLSAISSFRAPLEQLGVKSHGLRAMLKATVVAAGISDPLFPSD